MRQYAFIIPVSSFGDRTLVVLPMLLIAGPGCLVYVEKQNCVLMVGTADASLEPGGGHSGSINQHLH